MSTHDSWRAMIDRCDLPSLAHYKHYGGRGITYDPRWKDYKVFVADMGERPIGLTLDRIDNNGNYCKENCRWATYEEQANHTSRTRWITWQGKTQSSSQWDKELGFGRGTIRQRLDVLGWSLEKTMTVRPFVGRNVS